MGCSQWSANHAAPLLPMCSNGTIAYADASSGRCLAWLTYRKPPFGTGHAAAPLTSMCSKNLCVALRTLGEESTSGSRARRHLCWIACIPCILIYTAAWQGKEYWQRERDLCAAMLQHEAGARAAFSLDSVHACSSGKSFDYRVRGARGLAAPCTRCGGVPRNCPLPPNPGLVIQTVDMRVDMLTCLQVNLMWPQVASSKLHDVRCLAGRPLLVCAH